jgi:ABC-2 type transport system permease protein
VMVIASSRVQSLQAAHQIGSLVVLPIVLLLIVQITGSLLFAPLLVTVMGAAIWLGAVGTLMAGAGSLKRQALAVRL